MPFLRSNSLSSPRVGRRILAFQRSFSLCSDFITNLALLRHRAGSIPDSEENNLYLSSIRTGLVSDGSPNRGCLAIGRLAHLLAIASPDLHGSSYYRLTIIDLQTLVQESGLIALFLPSLANDRCDVDYLLVSRTFFVWLALAGRWPLSTAMGISVGRTQDRLFHGTCSVIVPLLSLLL